MYSRSSDSDGEDTGAGEDMADTGGEDMADTFGEDMADTGAGEDMCCVADDADD
jgi:hypothetical protein